jgi:hypothetical protein
VGGRQGAAGDEEPGDAAPSGIEREQVVDRVDVTSQDRHGTGS